MIDPAQADPLAVDFNPPYTLRGDSAILWVTKTARENVAEPGRLLPTGYKPLSLFGRMLGVVIVNRYDPPPEHPVPYREVIYATVFRRGLRLLYVAERLDLDNDFHVQLGRHYYGLPKHLDQTLTLNLADGVEVRSQFRYLSLAMAGPVVQALSYPLRVLASLLVGLFTRLFPVAGVLAPVRAAVLSISVPILRHRKVAHSGLGTGRVLWGQTWRNTKSVIRAPFPMQ